MATTLRAVPVQPTPKHAADNGRRAVLVPLPLRVHESRLEPAACSCGAVGSLRSATILSATFAHYLSAELSTFVLQREVGKSSHVVAAFSLCETLLDRFLNVLTFLIEANRRRENETFVFARISSFKGTRSRSTSVETRTKIEYS